MGNCLSSRSHALKSSTFWASFSVDLHCKKLNRHRPAASQAKLFSTASTALEHKRSHTTGTYHPKTAPHQRLTSRTAVGPGEVTSQCSGNVRSTGGARHLRPGLPRTWQHQHADHAFSQSPPGALAPCWIQSSSDHACLWETRSERIQDSTPPVQRKCSNAQIARRPAWNHRRQRWPAQDIQPTCHHRVPSLSCANREMREWAPSNSHRFRKCNAELLIVLGRHWTPHAVTSRLRNLSSPYDQREGSVFRVGSVDHACRVVFREGSVDHACPPPAGGTIFWTENQKEHFHFLTSYFKLPCGPTRSPHGNFVKISNTSIRPSEKPTHETFIFRPSQPKSEGHSVFSQLFD